MKTRDRDTRALEGLLDEYKMTSPIPPSIQERILEDKRALFIRILKSAGVFTAAYGIYVTISFALKKAGLAVGITKIVVTGAAAASVSYGAFRVAQHFMESEPMIRRESPAPAKDDGAITIEEMRAKYHQVYDIVLFDGRIVQGAILSRGDVVTIRTTGGVISVPRMQIRMIQPR